MTKIALVDQQGKKKGDVEVSEAVFNVPMNDVLVKQVYDVLSANARSGHAHAKDRSERAGSGKKPWKQKGTGRARTGSVRNPIWRKGGVIFGPTKDRNYTSRVNSKMKQKALCVVLSEKVRKNVLIIVDTLTLEEAKTKHMISLLKSLEVSGSIFVGFLPQEMDVKRTTKNIPRVSMKLIDDINIVDILNTKTLIMSEDSVKQLEKRLSV